MGRSAAALMPMMILALALIASTSLCVLGSPTGKEPAAALASKHSEPTTNLGRGYKVMSYDAQHDQLNIIDDEQPSTNLNHLDKHPYYPKRGHTLGHRGERWTDEDRLRVKHHHAKLLNKKRRLHQREHQQRDVDSDSDGRRADGGEPREKLQSHRVKTHKNKHHGKVLPSDPLMDHQWKEEYLQKLGDLKAPIRKEHDLDHHEFSEGLQSNLGGDRFHPETHKTLDRKELRKKQAQQAIEEADPYNKRYHKKSENPKKFHSFVKQQHKNNKRHS